MPLPNKKGWLAILFIFFCLAVPFGITYYVSTPTSKARFEAWRNRGTSGNVTAKSQVSAQQLLLVKNDRVMVKNTCLVFKGLEGGQVVLDLYLLDLDPGYAYPQRFHRETKAIRLGDAMYAVKSVNGAFLTLKVLQAMGAY
ncbi:MAG: hypothetical protein KKC20_23290 [Proteobacteria bacterium]|nr:hypothetical protein [Pseudomonadota bacterium]